MPGQPLTFSGFGSPSWSVYLNGSPVAFRHFSRDTLTRSSLDSVGERVRTHDTAEFLLGEVLPWVPATPFNMG